MRIDSVGLYNNRGLVQNKNARNAMAKNVAAQNKIAAQSEFKQTLSSAKATTATDQLTAAESSQIKQLFGQFDSSALKDVNNRNLDDSPGQFIDIVV
jgi:hypothetical protein